MILCEDITFNKALGASMNTKLLLLFVVLSQSVQADIKVKNPLISKADKKEENRRFRAKRKIEKKNEKLARKEWAAMSDFEKAQSPWETWYRSRVVPGLLKLSKIRKRLYRYNLTDVYDKRPVFKGVCDKSTYKYRTLDGTCNDLSDPTMGAAWTRFGRNTDPTIDETKKYDILYPNPRTISKELMERKDFKEVPFLNLLAVGWIQFMVHDWFSHGDNEDPSKTKPFFLAANKNNPGGEALIFPKTMIDTSMTDKEKAMYTRTFKNEVTHWWDASQLYGSSVKRSNTLRTFSGGQLKVNELGNLDANMMGLENTGFNRNWWLGLSLFHNIFTREHNAIALKLSKAYPKMKDEELFQKARLITAALIAKIHTVDWTPAILPSSHLRTAMRTNWDGLVNTTGKVKPWFEIFKQDFLFGIVGGKKNLNNTPFAMTEEFVSVYRMHPLLPDSITLQKIDDKKYSKTLGLNDIRETKVSKIYKENDLNDILYSFGQMHPGQLVLNNFPKALMNIEIPFVAKMDLAAMDILRDRERGVPRYNEFRRQFGMKPVKSFEQLHSNPVMVEKMKKLYNNDIEALDLLIGCLAESYRPTGFGFGETAFQVFVVMASRRLIADRFYTTSYNKNVYTKLGLKWIDSNNFKTVLLRHFPKLKKSLFGVKNAFNPWNK